MPHQPARPLLANQMNRQWTKLGSAYSKALPMLSGYSYGHLLTYMRTGMLQVAHVQRLLVYEWHDLPLVQSNQYIADCCKNL